MIHSRGVIALLGSFDMSRWLIPFQKGSSKDRVRMKYNDLRKLYSSGNSLEWYILLWNDTLMYKMTFGVHIWLMIENDFIWK